MNEEQKTIFVTIGIPGSGKTTFLKNEMPDVRVISPDLHLITDQGVYWWTGKRCKKAWKSAFSDVFHAVAWKDSFVFDATHIMRKSRKRILEIARENGYNIVALWFKTPHKICNERNDKRDEGRIVPELTMKNMINQFQNPDMSEGWTEIREIEYEEEDGKEE